MPARASTATLRPQRATGRTAFFREMVREKFHGETAVGVRSVAGHYRVITDNARALPSVHVFNRVQAVRRDEIFSPVHFSVVAPFPVARIRQTIFQVVPLPRFGKAVSGFVCKIKILGHAQQRPFYRLPLNRAASRRKQISISFYPAGRGPPGRNPPFAGGKRTVWEDGLRVPFLIAGPGVEAGVCSHVRAIAMDLFPTFAELAGAREALPAGVEGGSCAAVLKNGGFGEVQRPREEFVVHFPHCDQDDIGPASALLLGDFKLIRAYELGLLRLFHIAAHPGERRDLAAQMPEKVKELDARLTVYRKEMIAQMPKLNPDYDPAKPTETQLGGGKRKARLGCVALEI